MKMTRDNFGVLLTPIHRKIVFMAYNEKAPQYTDLFSVGSMTKKDETYPHLGAFGMWDDNNEGAVINEDSMSEGPTATFTAVRYDKGYSLTWELVRDDLYNVKKGLGIGGSAPALGKGLRTTIETKCATILNGGFSNTGYDSSALFATDHDLVDSATDGDNLITGAISDANVKAALTKLRGTLDEAGMKLGVNADILWAAADKEWDVYTILQSAGQSGTGDNDKNVIPRLRPVINDYLTAGYWGVKDSSYENLKFLWRDKPIFDSQPISKTVDHFMYGYARFDEGYMDWRGIVGSAG